MRDSRILIKVRNPHPEERSAGTRLEGRGVLIFEKLSMLRDGAFGAPSA
jgi:hypothetical protein